MTLDEMMSRFRLASREVFNQFFRVEDPYNNDGWQWEERFSDVQAVLFQKLVTEPAALPDLSYGIVNPDITVHLRGSDFAPIMLNREKDSGYWDHPVKEVTSDARMSFVAFFDWDQLDVRDNRYVRVRIENWDTRPETVGKHALVETQYVRFAEAQPAVQADGPAFGGSAA